MMTPTATVMERRQIDALIRQDPVEVVFMRRTKISKPGNSWEWSDYTPVLVNNKPQIVVMIPFKRRMTEFLVNTELGDVADLPYVIVGPHDLDVQRDDTFEIDGEQFVVRTIDLKKQVRKACQVDYFGGDPR